MEITSSNIVTISAVIGLLVFIVSMISEVTKSVKLLSKIPTNIHVIVLSLTLTIITYFAYISYSGDTIVWYNVFATIIAGFIVAYIVLFGWDKFIVLYKKFRNIPLGDIIANETTDITPAKSITFNDSKPASDKDTPTVDPTVTASTPAPEDQKELSQ